MIRLVGPASFDPLAPGRAARGLLDRLAAEPDDLPESDGAEAGLYLLLDDRQLRGFWVTLGASWLDEGTVAGVTPPFARAMLDAAVEALWWARYAVGPTVLGAWRPIVVLEWTPALAVRSNLAPPGVPASQAAAAPAPGGAARWLISPEADSGSGDGPADAVPWGHLPPERSLVCVLRGSMRWARNVHEGRFELVQLPTPDEAGLGIASMPASWRKRGLPLEEWVDVAAGQATRPEGEHHLGFPLQLPGRRVGFPITGWLTRDLEIQPPRPADAAVGSLVSRDTRNPVLARTAQAIAVTALVLVGTLGFSGGLQWISRPAIETAAPAIEPSAQPAFSVCSAEHGRFVDALACQVTHLAAGGQPGGARCAGRADDTDLQAAWCGLRDRDLDGAFTGSGHAWADVAASQACFEVLGRPWEYALDAVAEPIANPSKLLDDGQLRVNALRELVQSLDVACGFYRDRIATVVDGAILATHVGAADDADDPLRALVFASAGAGLNKVLRGCLAAGRDRPLGATTALEGLCRAPSPDGALPTDDGAAQAADEEAQEAKLGKNVPWQALGGPPESDVPSAVERYARARFANGWPTAGRWACHRRLTEGGARGEAPADWDLTVPVPGTWGESGVRTQLALDARLTLARAVPGETETCWDEVDRLLAGYTPLHPLLGPPAPEAWPSVQQRICGQVCEVSYRLTPAPDGKRATPEGDLAACLDSAAPFDPRTGGDDGVFDRLALPWNQRRDDAWEEPGAEALCAFHLVAQGRLPDVLGKDVAPIRWAGQPIPGSQLAGGRDGAAAEAADALVRYGRNRSHATCSRVAAQCYTERLLRVTGDPGSQPQLWREAWRGELDALLRASAADLEGSPWCRILRPYLTEPGRLPEGELDFPCALGVAETRDRVGAFLDRLVAGNATAGADAGGPR